MKLVLITFLTYFIFITNGHKLEPYHVKTCPSVYTFKYKLQTTVLDLDENSNVDLKTCVLNNVKDHSIILADSHYTNENAIIQRNKITEIPNVIIITKNITIKMLDLPPVKKRLKQSHRTQVYFTVTGDERFKCRNGTLNTTDFLFLETFMNKIWHRYKIMRVGVSFPFTCNDKMAIYNGKRESNYGLYDRTIKLIDFTNDTYKAVGRSGMFLTQGYPLRANIFYRFPTSVTECGNLHYYTKINLNVTDGYCGLDALVMYDMVKHFKFNLQLSKDENCYKYGYMTSNNTSGSLGCIVRKELDMSFNSRFMTKYSEDYIYFLHFVMTSSLCAMVKRPNMIPIEYYAISAYRAPLWLEIISLVVIIGVVTWAVARIKAKMVNKKRDSICFYITDAFTSLLFGFSLKKHGKLYILRGTCLCSSILFAAMYQGHINHSFTTLIQFEGIKTLDALYRSGYTLYINPSIKMIMQQLCHPENKQLNDFLARSHLILENYSPDLLLHHGNIALIGRREDVMIEIYSQYIDEHDRPMVNIVNECFYTYYLSYITQAGFPFYEELQRFMQRLGEAGLPIIYHKWTRDMFRVPHTIPKERNEPRPFAKISLKNQIIPFSILLIGYIVSFIVFIIELIRGRRNSHRAQK